MKFVSHKSQIRAIKQKDSLFQITDGFITASRAGFEIDQRCPTEYKMILSTCIDRGWLKPVAYMTEKEIMLNGLSNSK
jgi:hypothetical protein